jgi:hypothetical protein
MKCNNNLIICICVKIRPSTGPKRNINIEINFLNIILRPNFYLKRRFGKLANIHQTLHEQHTSIERPFSSHFNYINFSITAMASANI